MNTLKQINTEDLVEGQEYYVKMKYNGSMIQYMSFEDIAMDATLIAKDQPIFTLEEAPEPDNTDLEMLVQVASARHTDCMNAIIKGAKTAFPSNDELAREALELITACKNQLNKQP